MSGSEVATRAPARSLPWVAQLLVVMCLCGALGLVFFLGKARSANQAAAPAAPVLQGREQKPFVPSAAQLATFTVREVETHSFQVEHATEGKVGVDEDRATPIFSQYAGRVVRIAAKLGDIVSKGQVLATIEATDMVQAQNDLLAANGALNKGRSQLQLQQTIEKRQHDLYDSKAIALKEWQNAQNDLVTAQNDLRGAEGALEAVRNRLAILGKSEADIRAFLAGGRMSPETAIIAPIGGTVTQRKIGPGQVITAGSSDPVYTIGDLSTVWLLANVRESEAPNVAVGQAIKFRVLAFPDRVFEGRLNFVAAAVDPSNRRVQVRAEVKNGDGALKPEMFASVRIATGAVQTSAAVPREAVIYEADRARVWVLAEDGSAGLRQVKTGLVDGGTIQVVDGLKPGEKVVTRGSLFIDRLASGEAP